MPRRIAGRQPLGWLFSAPYLVFVAVVFAYPLGFAVWMSLHRYFFTAPGAHVPRPYVGLDNFRAALDDPKVRQSFANIAVFLAINVPLTVALSTVVACVTKPRSISGRPSSEPWMWSPGAADTVPPQGTVFVSAEAVPGIPSTAEPARTNAAAPTAVALRVRSCMLATPGVVAFFPGQRR